MAMRFWFFGASDIGAERQSNQDSILFLSGQVNDSQIGLAVVADGMGGLSDGEIASRMVVSAFETWWYEEMPDCLNQEPVWKALSDSIDGCICKVNEQVYQFSLQQGNAMGTTLTLAFLIDNQILIKNIGDSRGYFIKEGYLSQFTTDDSYQQKFRDQGYSDEEIQRQGIAQNILTKCVGCREKTEADSQMVWLNSDVLLCTDGVYQFIEEEKLANFLTNMDFESENYYFDKIHQEIYKNGARDNWSYVYIKKMELE
ncbi:MAG: protein phosphatase 2C domain-containing protein [Eubacteriales bacterium]|nr:protein phosphatase 2C domain-containing protein [Eubacteriales bacterium]